MGVKHIFGIGGNFAYRYINFKFIASGQTSHMTELIMYIKLR